MTTLTKAQIEAMLVGATQGKRCQFHPKYCPEAEGTSYAEWDTSHDLSVIRPDGARVRLAQYKHADDAALSQAAPDLARTAIALHDRVAELEGALKRLGRYGFECEAGPLTSCQEYIDIMGGSNGR